MYTYHIRTKHHWGIFLGNILEINISVTNVFFFFFVYF